MHSRDEQSDNSARWRQRDRYHHHYRAGLSIANPSSLPLSPHANSGARLFPLCSGFDLVRLWRSQPPLPCCVLDFRYLHPFLLAIAVLRMRWRRWWHDQPTSASWNAGWLVYCHHYRNFRRRHAHRDHDVGRKLAQRVRSSTLRVKCLDASTLGAVRVAAAMKTNQGQGITGQKRANELRCDSRLSVRLPFRTKPLLLPQWIQNPILCDLISLV
jgi:hypothetical protein